MLAAKIIGCSRIRILQCTNRQASALPRASPNEDEFCEEDRKQIRLNKSFAPAETKQSELMHVIESSEKEVREAKLKKDWRRMEPNGLLQAYLQLSKHRLTMLITSTAASGYLISSLPINYSTLGACLIGTALLSSSANACNHILEAPYDAQMRRTQKRVLVIHRITPLHALMFAAATSTAGLGFLCVGCNALTSGLGFLNLVLYAAVYTPMKRYHIGCTWMGAIVGAIPPLMGYTASTGRLDLSALTLAGILYSWQFPHFNALSWNLRGDYSRAGYRVMCVTNEELCRRTTLRHSIALLGFCSIAAPMTQLTNWVFAIDSIPLNLAMIYFGHKFYSEPNEKTAKTLFRFSLLYLPLVMMLMVISNAGGNLINNAKSNENKVEGSFPEIVE